jgi:hypothetical protein
MKILQKLAGLVVLLPLAAGCAARSAPFDQMDRAQITVLRLSQSQPAAAPVPQAGGLPGLPGLPAIPPEMAQLGQQALQGLQNALPGVIPPGLIPGAPGPGQAQQLPLFKGFSVVATVPVMDAGLKDELLDIFGHESNFSSQVQPCFAPGMGIVLQRPNAPEVDLLISLSCNQAKMDGARWPHPVNGFTPDTARHISKIYENLWGPVPPGA